MTELEQAQRTAAVVERYRKPAAIIIGLVLTYLMYQAIFGPFAFHYPIIAIFLPLWLITSAILAFVSAHYEVKAKMLSEPEGLPRARVVSHIKSLAQHEPKRV